MPNRSGRATALRTRLRGISKRPDSGFTLVELIIAMVIVFVVVTAMLGLFVGSLETTVAAKQRQAASATATQNLERLRALPYDVIRAGVNSTDLTGDPNVSGTPARLQVDGIDEVLVTSTTQAQEPLFPHRRTEAVDGVDYVVSVYVTEGTTTNPSFQLTSVVTWEQAGSGAARQIVQRSTAYSPAGCLSLSNRPFSGPCQAGFSAQAGITAGGITVTNATDSTALIPGTNGSLLALELAGASTSTAVEQAVTVSASSRGVGASHRTTTVDATSGGFIWAANADTDPSSASNTSNASGSGMVPEPPASSLTLSGAAGTFTAVPSTSHQASVSGEVTGTSALCRSVIAAPMMTGQPCATASIASTATPATLSLDPAAPAFLVGGLGAMTLASVDTSATPSRAVAGRLVGALSGYCPGTSGDGCSFADSSRTLGTVTLGGLPPATRAADQLPDGLGSGQPLVRVTGLQESARAESGYGARAPSFQRSGQLEYWDGDGYEDESLAGLVAGDQFVLPEAVATYRNVLGLPPHVTVSARAVVRVGATTETQVNTLPCNETTGECTSSSTSATALSGEVEYVVTRYDDASDPGTELTRFVVVTDLGTVTASTYYQAAPAS